MASIRVDVGRETCRASELLIGANLEDLNYQLTGGIDSQLLYGESLQEPPAPDGAAGVSGQWRPVATGSASGQWMLDTARPHHGRQSQRIEHSGGAGEIGVDNAGLNRWGIALAGGRAYEGFLRLWSERPVEVRVSLRSADGRVLAERRLVTDGDGETYEKLAFTLEPASGDVAGRFAVTLGKPGAVTLGYAFLQSGPWGRFHGLPVRRDLAEALISQGVKLIRFNGSMIDPTRHETPHTLVYRWKDMIGPRDERPPYRGSFNPFAGHGWGIFELLAFCEDAGIVAVPGLNMLESPEDVADFIEYANGAPSSAWGLKRAEHGHPRPFGLRYLQLGNEERIDAEYARRFKALASAIWTRDRSVVPVVGDWMYREGIADHQSIRGANCSDLSAHVDILRWARSQGREIWWDVHVCEPEPRSAEIPRDGVPGVHDLRRWLGTLAPECGGVQIPVLEENAGNHDLARGLGHARMKNELMRMGGYVAAAAAPNTFQPWEQYTDKGWDQGAIFYTPTRVWFQPSYYVDRMIARWNAPLVVHAEASSPAGALDATARVSWDGRRLVLQVVNVEAAPIEAVIEIAGFLPVRCAAQVETIAGDLRDANTLEKPEKVKPVEREVQHELRGGRMTMAFAGYSFSTVVLE